MPTIEVPLLQEKAVGVRVVLPANRIFNLVVLKVTVAVKLLVV